MGFFGDLGKSILEKSSEISRLKSEYSSKSDAELKDIATSDGFFGNSSTERMVAKAILRERGYSSLDEI